LRRASTKPIASVSPTKVTNLRAKSKTKSPPLMGFHWCPPAFRKPLALRSAEYLM
jgi:hypothetical protein